jgi:hypothetical protein
MIHMIQELFGQTVTDYRRVEPGHRLVFASEELRWNAFCPNRSRR